MDYLNDLCSECGHVRMWSGLRHRRFWKRLLRKKSIWYCSVGHGEKWGAIAPCSCRNVFHKMTNRG